MKDIDGEKIQEYKKLIEEYGAEKAAKMLKESGIFYDEDFTEKHRTDPIFSDPASQQIQNYIEVGLNIEIGFEKNVIDGNLYSPIYVQSGKESEKLPFTNSIFDRLRYARVTEELPINTPIITGTGGHPATISQINTSVTR